MQQKDRTEDADNHGQREPNVLPPTEVSKNPNPRANENITTGETKNRNEDTEGVGSEITDGEDA